MALKIEMPFVVFFDADGDPLEDGYVYVGVSGFNPEANPINVYFDINLTIPSVQPIRTIGGYLSNDGSPANIYVGDEDYSILVKNKKGELVYSSLSNKNSSKVNYDAIFDTVASMKAVSPVDITGSSIDIIEGMTILTQGYYSAGDGGGSVYFTVSPQAADEYSDHTLTNGNVAVLQTKQDGIARMLQWGIKLDYLTDNQPPIQAANDYLESIGGGIIELPPTTSTSEIGVDTPIVQSNKVIISGANDIASTIKALATFTGTAIVKSKNFDSLTGTGAWLTSAGVQYGLGFNNILLDGAGLSIKGVQYFAKRIMIGTLFIQDCLSGGWYSEAGSTTGQTDITDMPESKIDYLSVRGCGGRSIDIYGPHDSTFGHLISRCGPAPTAGTTGVNIGATANSSGNCDIGMIHVYGHEKGFVTESLTDQVKANLIIAESITGRAVTLNGSNAQISKMELYKNNTGLNIEAFNCLVVGSRNQIDNIRCNDTNAGGGVKITGDRNRVNFSIDGVAGAPSEGVVRIAGNHNVVNGRVYNTTGVALWTQPGAGVIGNRVTAEIENATTAWQNDNAGSENLVDLILDLTVGQTAFTGTRLTRGEDNLKINGDVNGTPVNYPQRILDTGTVDLTITTLQTITVNHNVPFQPYIEHVSAVLGQNTAVTDFAVDFIKVKTTTSTTVTIEVKLGTASVTAGALANLLVTIGC